MAESIEQLNIYKHARRLEDEVYDRDIVGICG